MKKKILLLFAVLGAASFIFMTAFISVQTEISNMQTETYRLQAIEKDLRKLQARQKIFELTTERFDELKRYLPSKPAQEIFTAEIYHTAEKNKIAITNLQVGELINLENEKNFLRQSVKIQIEGDYISILNFLREISDGERFTRLENISLESSRENFIICNVEFYIYSSTM